MATPKLTYFKVRGLAETIRILLKYGNVEFEDVRLEKSDWPAVKNNFPFGQLPIYEDEGRIATQSTAISRYLAKKFGLTGANDWEDLEIDAIVDTISDLRTKSLAIFMESDPNRKETMKQDFLIETAPYYMDRFEKIAEQNDDHMAVKKFTWADIFFLTNIDVVNAMVGQDLTEKYPHVQAVRKNVSDMPVIKNWIESRPKTDF